MRVFQQIRVIITILFLGSLTAFSQTTVFTFQGKLTDMGNPANGNYQMEFKMFDALSGGNQIGTTVSDVAVTVAQGIFTTPLDFGVNAFPGADRFLEIGVRRNSGESYVTLTPRQQISSSPYAIKAISAQQADLALNSNQLGGVAASEYLTNTAALGSFIRNGTTLQNANFNISGNGLFGGNVGIGMTNPANRLDVFGGVRSLFNASTGILVETTGGTNSWAKFSMKTPNRLWSIGTSQNFNGDQFYVADETVGQIRMAISNGGLVGINNANPQAGLDIRGTNLQVQQRITDNTSGNSLVLQGGAGGNMKITGYNYNSNTAVPLYLSTDGANTILNSSGGNVLQPGSGYGLPKAMAYVLANGTIARCYNGVTGASTGNCGFSVSHGSAGVYVINFGFPAFDRFISLTPLGSTSDCNAGDATLNSLLGNTATVYTFCTVFTDKAFMILVF